MTNRFTKSIAAAVALFMLIASVCTANPSMEAMAKSDSGHTGAMGRIADDIVLEVPSYYYSDSKLNRATPLPSSYDLRDYNRVTSVKDQNPFGTCWAFAAIGSIESGLITRGYADTSIDLSEKHLAYYAYHEAADKLGNTAGDYATPIGQDYLNFGGNSWIATSTLAGWNGVVYEETMPYDTEASFDPDQVYDAALAYSSNVYHVDNVYWVLTASSDYIKQLIIDKGACDASIFYDDAFFNSATSAFCAKDVEGTNHAVLIVGWDDNYDKSNFPGDYQPQNNGAWLVRNSWGADWWGDEGYFWLSYEDSSFCAADNEVAFYEAAPVGNDLNIYQYDGGAVFGYYQFDSGISISNIYTAGDDNEALNTVSFYTYQPNMSYSAQVYTGVSSKPTDGTAAFDETVDGTVATAGYHSIALSPPVELTKGERFAVVLRLTVQGNDNVLMPCDYTYNYSNIEYTSAATAGHSFYSYNGTYWWDITGLDSSAVLRLKASSFGTEVPMIHPLTLTDTETGISLTTSALETSVTESTALSVSTPELSAAAQAAVDELGTQYEAYMLALSDGETSVTPSNEVSISIPLPTGYSSEQTKLYRIDSEGAATELTPTFADGKLSFSTDQIGIFAVVSTAPARIPGDVNDDGEVNGIDSLLLRRHLAEWRGVDINLSHADVNADGEVNGIDSLLLRRSLAEWPGVVLS